MITLLTYAVGGFLITLNVLRERSAESRGNSQRLPQNPTATLKFSQDVFDSYFSRYPNEDLIPITLRSLILVIEETARERGNIVVWLSRSETNSLPA